MVDPTPLDRDRSGFSLIEMVVVLAILTVLAGLIAPYLSVGVRIERSEATVAYMDELEKALTHYGSDLWVYPTSLDELLSNVSSVAGWRGPYAVHRFSATGTGNSGDIRQDAWSESYAYTLLTTTTARIRSAGDDRSFGTGDDIVKDLDLTPVLRAETQRRVDSIDASIASYNSDHLPDNPLPNSSYPLLRAALVAAGYLQNSAWSATDAWGDEFVIVDANLPPPTRVQSIH